MGFFVFNQTFVGAYASGLEIEGRVDFEVGRDDDAHFSTDGLDLGHDKSDRLVDGIVVCAQWALWHQGSRSEHVEKDGLEPLLDV